MLTELDHKSKDNALRPVLTRHSNTGLDLTFGEDLDIRNFYIPELKASIDKPVEGFVDWITLNGKLDPASYEKFVSLVLIGEFWDRNDEVSVKTFGKPIHRGGAKFRDKLISENGIECHTMPLDEEREGRAKINCQIRGEVLGRLFHRNDGLEYARFLWEMDQLGITVSRIDNSIQDSSKSLDILELLKEVLKGNYTGVNKHDYRSSGGRKGVTGTTLYLGSRQSDSYYRIYDTWEKHKEIGIRVENEVKDKKARYLQGRLSMIYERYLDELEEIESNAWMQCDIQHSYADMVQNSTKVAYMKSEKKEELKEKYRKSITLTLKSMCLGNIDFIDMSKKHKNGSLKDCKRLKIWEDFIRRCLGSLDVEKIRVSKPKTGLKDKFKWVHKSVKKILGVFSSGLPSQDFIGLMKYLLLEDRTKKYPKEIEQERELMIVEMRKKGINALLDDEQLKEIRSKYSLEFETGNYDEYAENTCFDNPDIVNGRNRTKLYQYLENNADYLRPIYEQFPLIFEAIMKFLRFDEQEMVRGYLSNWTELECEDRKLINQALFV